MAQQNLGPDSPSEPETWPRFTGGPLSATLADLRRSQHWRAQSLTDGQQSLLTRLLRWSAVKVAHYRDAKWAAQAVEAIEASPSAFWDIWRELPILTKAELRSEGVRLRTEDVPVEHLPLGTSLTSGSTGISVEVATTAVTRRAWDALTVREMQWSGRQFQKRLGAIRYLPKADREPEGHASPTWPRLISQFHDTGAFGIIHVGHPVDALARWLRLLDPHYLITHPSVAEALLEEIGEKPASLEQILFVAEPLSPSLEARLQETWGVHSTEYYSANEVGYIAFRCAEHGKLHVQSESVLVEIVDASGNRCAAGETGRVVVTPLHNLATPLIRYDLGDLAMAGSLCGCGKQSPTIERVLGRVRNLVRTPDGRRFWPVDLGKFRSMGAIKQVQYVQTARDTIELRVVLNRPLTPEEEMKAKELATDALGHPFKVEIAPLPAIERSAGGKFEEFLSLLPQED